jgi:hypothetical protein
MLWYGGASYGACIEDDLETFGSLAELRHAFARRLGDAYYPCVSDDTPDNGGPEGYVYLYDPRGVDDPYPDRLISFGPRGGVRVERC